MGDGDGSGHGGGGDEYGGGWDGAGRGGGGDGTPATLVCSSPFSYVNCVAVAPSHVISPRNVPNAPTLSWIALGAPPSPNASGMSMPMAGLHGCGVELASCIAILTSSIC